MKKTSPSPSPRSAKHDFKIIVSGTTLDPPGATYGPRKEDRYEIIWIIEGEVKATYDQQVIKAGPDTILFKKANVTDYYEWSPTHRTVHAFVQFDLDDERRKLADKCKKTVHVMAPDDVFRSLFGYLLHLGDRKEPLRSRMMHSTLELMLDAYLSQVFTVKPPPPAHLTDTVMRVIDIIRTNMLKDQPDHLDLKELAESAHTTRGNLCRIFQKSLGLGPLEYVKLARLERAADQLRRTSSSLKEIAIATGFYDSFHLSKSFKKVYGVSPKEFRDTPSQNFFLSQKNPIINITQKGKFPPCKP